MKQLEDIRKQYELADLDVRDCSDDPIEQLELWLEEAITHQINEPTSLCLSTIGLDGHPNSRIVLLKGVKDGQLIFYTNYESIKGQEMERHPHVSLNFHWKPLERQVRIRGTVTKLDQGASAEYFQSRSKASQISAWASPQSQVVEGRAQMQKRWHEVESKYQDAEVLPLPPHWGGYQVSPGQFEFWQGRQDRYHDRISYRQKDGAWYKERLAP